MILITGAAGYIGRALIARLEELDLNFRATDLFSCEAISPSTQPIEAFDVTDRKQWIEMTQGVDTVIHLAAESDLTRCEQNPENSMKTNLLSVYYLTQAACKNGINKVIFPSSFAVYGSQQQISEEAHPSPNGLYAYMKYWAEEMLMQLNRTKGTEIIIFRQSNICGRGPIGKRTVVQVLVDKWRDNSPLTIYGTGAQHRNFLDIRDCVRAYIAAVECKGTSGIYNLGGPSTITIQQLAHLTNQLGSANFGRMVPIINQTTNVAESREDDTMSCSFEKIQAALGYSASVTIQDTILDMMKESNC